MVSTAIACALLRTLRQDRVDMDGILNELLHFRADRAEFGHSKIDQGGFEGRELPAAKLS